MSSFFKRFFRISNRIRIHIINTIFWLFILILVFVLSKGNPVSTGTTLHIQFSGTLYDSNQEGNISDFLSSNGKLSVNTVLQSVISSITIAKDDKNISEIILDLDDLVKVGYGAMEEIGVALLDFKESGKGISAYSSFYTQGQYFIASFADEIIMDPYGDVEITGIGIYRNYWKDTFDKFAVDVQVFKAGAYKSYVEPYISNSMSDSVKIQNLEWMNNLWKNYRSTIVNNREVSNFDQNVQYAKGCFISFLLLSLYYLV